jgi:hypothetical protein
LKKQALNITTQQLKHTLKLNHLEPHKQTASTGQQVRAKTSCTVLQVAAPCVGALTGLAQQQIHAGIMRKMPMTLLYASGANASGTMPLANSAAHAFCANTMLIALAE